jgi:hypothetical protein
MFGVPELTVDQLMRLVLQRRASVNTLEAKYLTSAGRN